MDGGGVALPLRVHVVDVVGVLAAHEVVVGAEGSHGIGRCGGEPGASINEKARLGQALLGEHSSSLCV